MNNITSVADFRRHEKYFQSIIVKSRKINRERIEPGNEGKNIVTQDNCQEQNGTRIYRRGQKLGVYEAPRRRRFIDLTSRIPQPLTIYTNWVPPLQRIYISAERENKRGRTANHHCKKKYITIDPYVLISTRG